MSTPEAVTTLRCDFGRRATKRWRLGDLGPECDGYDCGAWFSVGISSIDSLAALANEIDRIRQDPRSFAIMGEPLPDTNLGRCRRLLHRQQDGTPATFRAKPRHWLPLDFVEVPGPFPFDTANA